MKGILSVEGSDMRYVFQVHLYFTLRALYVRIIMLASITQKIKIKLCLHFLVHKEI